MIVASPCYILVAVSFSNKSWKPTSVTSLSHLPTCGTCAFSNLGWMFHVLAPNFNGISTSSPGASSGSGLHESLTRNCGLLGHQFTIASQALPAFLNDHGFLDDEAETLILHEGGALGDSQLLVCWAIYKIRKSMETSCTMSECPSYKFPSLPSLKTSRKQATKGRKPWERGFYSCKRKHKHFVRREKSHLC